MRPNHPNLSPKNHARIFNQGEICGSQKTRTCRKAFKDLGGLGLLEPDFSWRLEESCWDHKFSKGRSRQLAWHLTPGAPMDQCSVRTTSGTRVLEVESNKIQSKVNQSIFVWKRQGLTTKTSPVAYHLRVAPWHSWAAGLLVAHEGSWARGPLIWYASDWIQKVKLHGTAPSKDDTSRLQLLILFLPENDCT